MKKFGQWCSLESGEFKKTPDKLTHKVESKPEVSADAHREVVEYVEKLEKAREELNEIAIENAEKKAEIVREKIREYGVNMETMRDLMQTLEETGFEAFSPAELNRIIAIISHKIFEVDPAYKQYYQDLKKKLMGIVGIQ